ncbi:hypothetical protein L3Y34_016960 [Caenorhabditis briggsae]|uniref:Uncharacterized protein n=1 Tax=Caenorhabditis briggsae TaxID=6238 RepID=A0AAE9ISC7_CAEBR|nr:hypothetical protein L3Y34_016960 [Caenorhabditis briggsae]
MDSGSDVEPPPKVSKTGKNTISDSFPIKFSRVDELVKKLEGLIGSHQYARQLLLKDDDRIGKKFFNASSGKHAFVIDFRISKGKTTAAVQYEGERKPIHIDFDHFQKSIDDGTFQFS